MKREHEIKKIFKAYKKYKHNLVNTMTATQQFLYIMEDFVASLQLMRDYYALKEGLAVDGKDNLKVSLLDTALCCYRNWNSCINNYYDISEGYPRLKPGLEEASALEAYSAEYAKHWDTFWQVVSECMPVWQAQDDTIVISPQAHNELNI